MFFKVTCKDWMAEWSKALHLSCSLFGGGGSNPTPVNLKISYSKKKNTKKIRLFFLFLKSAF